MISLLVASAVTLTALQAGIDVPRKNFSACLKAAYSDALSKKVDVAAYGAFLAAACSAQADGLRGGLIAFDVKNGIKRSQAAADAQAQIDDYLAMSSENYEARAPKKDPVQMASPAPAPTQSATPPPTAASAPKNSTASGGDFGEDRVEQQPSGVGGGEARSDRGPAGRGRPDGRPLPDRPSGGRSGLPAPRGRSLRPGAGP